MKNITFIIFFLLVKLSYSQTFKTLENKNMWFEKLTGFKEKSPDYVRENLLISKNMFISKINGKKFTFGELEIPTLEDLKKRIESLEIENKPIRVSEIVTDVQFLHKDIQNKNALFQVASQFNLLEMINPNITPEQGIERYENDYTQGPACAIACGAGTIYRNYFVKIGNQIGQTKDSQIDCLELIAKELKNDELNLWTMKNGYALLNQEGLNTLNNILTSLTNKKRESLKDKLKIGIQWDTEVTISENKQKVSQIFCSALPVAYSQIKSKNWEEFAKLILEATYEATFCTALINYEKFGSNKVFLTMVGGGAFGNDEKWIIESIEKIILKYKNFPLDVKILSYGTSNPNLKRLILN